jgi:hypothetical protein
MLGSLLAVVAMVGLVAVGTRTVRADPRDFTLINNSESIITHLYVQPSGPDEEWGDDILGVSVLEPGQEVLVYFERFTEGNCLYDLKVTLEDSSEYELLDQDLCETFTISFP